MLNLRVGVLVLALACATACGEKFVSTGDGGNHSTGRDTSSSGGAAGLGGSSSTSLSTLAGTGGSTVVTSTGAGGVGSTADTGGSGGAVGFHATCSGTVDCPDMLGCADWTYTIDDDEVTTVVTAGVDVASSGVSCLDQTQYATSQDAGQQVTGNIMFPCDTQTWAFGIDRQTKLVYVKEMTMGYSWTPPCR